MNQATATAAKFPISGVRSSWNRCRRRKTAGIGTGSEEGAAGKTAWDRNKHPVFVHLNDIHNS